MEILSGTIHELPNDMRELLSKSQILLEKWDNLTPLSRNEWICRVTIPKKEETRINHLKRLCEDLSNGKKRPCCWPWCPHHRESAKKWFEKKPQNLS